MTNLKRILTLSVGLVCLVPAVAWASLGGITKRQSAPSAPKLTVQIAVAEVRATPQVLEAGRRQSSALGFSRSACPDWWSAEKCAHQGR